MTSFHTTTVRRPPRADRKPSTTHVQAVCTCLWMGTLTPAPYDSSEGVRLAEREAQDHLHRVAKLPQVSAGYAEDRNELARVQGVGPRWTA